MVQGNLRLVSIRWTERAAAEDPGARPLPAQGQAVLASLPQVRAFARLLQGIRADLRDANLSLQDCKQWGNGDESFSQPKVAGSGGQGEDKFMEIHIPGSWGRTRSPTLDRTLENSHGPLEAHPVVGRVPRQKLHPRMEGRRGRGVGLLQAWSPRAQEVSRHKHRPGL